MRPVRLGVPIWCEAELSEWGREGGWIISDKRVTSFQDRSRVGQQSNTLEATLSPRLSLLQPPRTNSEPPTRACSAWPQSTRHSQSSMPAPHSADHKVVGPNNGLLQSDGPTDGHLFPNQADKADRNKRDHIE